MDLIKLFEAGQKDGLFTDYQVSVRGPIEYDAEGGVHISSGAKLFDIASLTKAFTHLVYLKMFSEGRLSPESLLSDYIKVPGAGERKIWHLLSYLAQNYTFDFNALRNGGMGSFKGVLLERGFSEWKVTHGYDNYSSAYLGFLLEETFGSCLEEILHCELGLYGSEVQNLLFHPVTREFRCQHEVVPTSSAHDGRVHDTLAKSHEDEGISVAGLFSKASVVADVFHRNIDRLIQSGFYDVAAVNQLERVGISPDDHFFAMGFDIPYPHSIETPIELPLVFAGFTGCRLFFAKEPRVTVCFLTNRVFMCDDSPESQKLSQKRFKSFSWRLIREVLRSVTPTA